MSNETETAAGFDREEWAAAGGLPPASNAREAMAAGLEARLPGMSRDEMIGLLGEPEEILGGGDHLYYLASTIFGGEYRVLLVKLDEAGRVTYARNVSTETWQ